MISRPYLASSVELVTNDVPRRKDQKGGALTTIKAAALKPFNQPPQPLPGVKPCA